MKNAIAVAALAVGLAFGSASASFADNVDGGAHPHSGVPTVSEQGANTARGVSRSGRTDAYKDHHMNHHFSKQRRKRNTR